MKLIDSKDFGKTLINETDSEYRRKRDLFDMFLEQPLKLEMFVPCDENNNPLIKPSIYDPRSGTGNTDYHLYDQAELEYEKAVEKVLFQGLLNKKFTSLSGDSVFQIGKEINFRFNEILELRNGSVKFYYKTLEDLIHMNLTLTHNAIEHFV